jgi:hypothetical protein
LCTKGSVLYPQEHDLLCIRRKLKGGGVWIAHARVEMSRAAKKDEVPERFHGSVAGVHVARFTISSPPVGAALWTPPVWLPDESPPLEYEVAERLWSAGCFTVELLPITLPDRLKINCVQQLPPSRPVARLLGLPGALDEPGPGPALSLEAICKGSTVFQRLILNLNSFQVDALKRGLRGDPVVNIWGVPGSGKTKTASAMIRLFVRAQQLTDAAAMGHRKKEGQEDWGWNALEGGEQGDEGEDDESDGAAAATGTRQDEMEGGDASEANDVTHEHGSVVVFAGPSNRAVDVMAERLIEETGLSQSSASARAIEESASMFGLASAPVDALALPRIVRAYGRKIEQSLCEPFRRFSVLRQVTLLTSRRTTDHLHTTVVSTALRFLVPSSPPLPSPFLTNFPPHTDTHRYTHTHTHTRTSLRWCAISLMRQPGRCRISSSCAR